MGLRFRRSIKLAPGIRWNLSGSGSSFTFGPRGLSVNVGKRGVYLNASVPGTGLYSRTRLDVARPPTAPSASSLTPRQPVQSEVQVGADGKLVFLGADGAALPQYLADFAKRAHRNELCGLLERARDKINADIDALATLHEYTPDCRLMPEFELQKFEEPMPEAEAPRTLTLFEKLLPSLRSRAKAESDAARLVHQSRLQEWTTRRSELEVAQHARRLVEHEILIDVRAMAAFLEGRLVDIVWPRETSVQFELSSEGTSVVLEVDLPRIAEMPMKRISVDPAQLCLSGKNMRTESILRLYVKHTQSVVFRLVGEVFAALPTVMSVVVSGFSQRLDPLTSTRYDECLLSVRASRGMWEMMDFAALEKVDVESELGRHEFRRCMQPSGNLLAVAPLAEFSA